MYLVFMIIVYLIILVFFFFNDTATTEIYTLSLHDALPIYAVIGRDGQIANLTLASGHPLLVPAATEAVRQWVYQPTLDRKSTRLNSSHANISYAVFCLKKKKK